MFRLLALVALGVIACSGISVTRLDDRGAGAHEGIPYNLAMTSFDVEITRRVVKCVPHLGGNVAVRLAPKKQLDPSQRYLLEGNGFFASSDVKGEFSTDGVTTALNTTSTDTTATIVANVAELAAIIAPLAAAAVKGKPGEAPPPPIDCTPPVATAVTETVRLEPATKTAAEDLAKTTSELSLVTRELAALGAATDAETKRLRAQLLQDQDRLIRSQQRKHDALDSLQQLLEEQLKITTDVRHEQWPENGDELATPTEKPFRLTAEVMRKWSTSGDSWDATHFDVHLRLTHTGAVGRGNAPNDPPASIDTCDGVPVRFGSVGRLDACSAAPCGSDGATRLASHEGPILQLGPVYLADVSGGMFETVTGGISFDADGIPKTVQVVNSASTLATATGAAKEVATKVAGIPAAIDAAKTAKAKAGADLLAAKAALAKAKADGATTEQIAALEADTALAQAKLAKINAEKTLAEAEKPLE